MNGDFTRLTFDPIKHYAGVLMQQGRVQLDADWNELVQIVDHRLRTQLKDTLGFSGAPEDRPGFIINPTRDGKLMLRPGRLYVDGLLCELHSKEGKAELDVNDQPFQAPAVDLDLEKIPAGGSRTDLVYVEAWRRHVSVLEDPSLREEALGGPDTTTRMQTVWQVRVIKGLREAGNVDCYRPVKEFDALTRPGQGRMTVEDAGGEPLLDPCLVGSNGGYSGLENRLYRVEIHDPGAVGKATYKWSRDNGAVGARVLRFPSDPKQVQVDSLGRDALTRFQPRQWVEVIGDRSELRERRGTLARIEKVLVAERTLVLDRPVNKHADEPNPRVRRWDMAKELPVTSASLADLEHGIQVSFDGTGFRAGDYWHVTARSGQGTLTKFTKAPPHGEGHRYARLGLVVWKRDAEGALSVRHEVCVPTVPSLASLAARPDCCEVIPSGSEIGARLQERLDAIVETGGSLCLPAGVHIIDRPLTIRADRPIVIAGCAGNTRLVYKPEPGWSGPMFTIRGGRGVATHDVTLRELCLYAHDAPALVAIENARDTRIEDCMLVNLPGATSAPAIVAGRNTDGLKVDGCRILGGIAVEAISGSIPQAIPPEGIRELLVSSKELYYASEGREAAVATNLSEKEIMATAMVRLPRLSVLPSDTSWLERLINMPKGLSAPVGDDGIARLTLNECLLRGRFLGVHVDKASGFTVEACDVGGLTAAGWNEVTMAAGDLSFDVIPGLEDALHKAFVGAQHPEALAPIALSVLIATDALVSRSELRGGMGLTALALEKAEFLENRIAGAAGLTILYGSKVEVTQNEVAVLTTGLFAGGLAADWDVRANRLIAARAVAFVTAEDVETRLRTAYGAVSTGLRAYQDGPEGVDVNAFDEAASPGPAGAALSQDLLGRVDDLLGELGRLGDTGRIAAAHVSGNAIAATDLGVTVEPGVRCSDLRIGENLIICARLAGIRLHGQAQSATLLDWTYSAGQLISGNRVRVAGVGISVETNGAVIMANRLETQARARRAPLIPTLANALKPMKLAPTLMTGIETGRGGLLRTGLAEAALRIQKQTAAADEVRGLTEQIQGPLTATLKERGLTTEMRLLDRAVKFIGMNKPSLAALHLRTASQYLSNIVDSPGIRIAADGVAATSNAIVATGDASGGIAIDPPPRASSGGDRPMLHSITIRENEILGGAGHGVDIGVAVKGLQVAGNMIRDMRGNGISTTADARGLEEADVAHNHVLGCCSGKEPGPAGRAAGILFESASLLRIVDNVVRAVGNERDTSSVGIGVVMCTDAAVRGNSVRENGGTGAASTDEGNGAGLFVWDCAGAVHIADNSVTSNRSRAMLARMGSDARLSVTGNTFDGARSDRDHLVLIQGDADIIFSQNQVSYVSPEDDAGTSLYARRASIVGNIWNEQNCALALLLDADAYSMIGNVSARTAWAPVSGQEQVADHNVPQPKKEGDKPVVPPVMTPLRPFKGSFDVSVGTILQKAVDRVEILPTKPAELALPGGGIKLAPEVEKASTNFVNTYTLKAPDTGFVAVMPRTTYTRKTGGGY